MAKLTNEEIISSLKEMSVLELNELVKAVEKEFGVSAAAPVAAAAAAADEGPVKAGPSEVSLILKGLGTGSKVAIIKAVQAITGLGLMDAKKLVDAVPATIKEKISPVEAEEHKKALVAAGAEVEVK
ncbi:MAG: 50S ribosomal protein L7 [Tenericutes bacterium ADurb.BinA155]|jgi:large subunit ribosomal protein L7/L12|nr:MAG: 50S ribosomal protein L7 [Tenericutes bacterium ADurb.BinA155]